MLSSTVTVITSCLALPLIVLVVRLLVWPKPIKGIPHNEISSIWGDMLTVGRASKETGAVLLYYFEPMATRLGPIYQLLIGPFQRIVIISDAQETEDILLRRPKSFDKSPLQTNVTRGILRHSHEPMPTNDEWRRRRNILAPAMTAKYLSSMTVRISSNVLQLVDMWREKIKIVAEHNGVCFPCEKDFQLCTMDIVGDIAFGEGFDNIKMAQASLEQVDPIVDYNGGTTFPHIQGSRLHKAAVIIFESRTKKWAQARKDLLLFMERRLRNSRAEALKQNALGMNLDASDCVLDMIIEREGKDDAKPLTDEEIYDELLLFILGGQDSTSSALSTGLKYLTNHPDVQAQLRAELLSTVPPANRSNLTYDDVSTERTPYLEAVVAEILRCAGVAAASSRRTTEDVLVLGSLLPKGTEVLFLHGHCGLNSDKSSIDRSSSLNPVRSQTSLAHGLSSGLWEAQGVQDFMPERWLVNYEGPNSISKVKFSAKQGVSNPFGLGYRACYGQKLAVLELKIFIATLNLAFFFDKVPEPLNVFKFKEHLVSRHSVYTYICPKEWD